MILLIYLIYQILASSQTVSTASIEPLLSAAKGNRTTLHKEISPPWILSPITRGTSDILWSCLITLTACVYTALHLNVPPANEGKLGFYWRKSKWVTTALFAPEIVLYCALTQFLEARKLVEELKKLWSSQQTPQKLAKKLGTTHNLETDIDFSLEYGFFVVMGGIVTEDVAKLVDVGNQRFALKSSAVLLLAREGRFLDIPPAMISDKSKANFLGKSLVCIQVTWFFVQWTTRLAAKYPLALVEIHTVVHVVCALSMYILWWKKPQDISEPVILDMSDSLDSLAIMTVSSNVGYAYEAFHLWYFGDEGLKSSSDWNDWVPDGITNLSAKDELRWSKLCEWLDHYFSRNPAVRKPQSEGRRLSDLLADLETYVVFILVSNASNMPEGLLDDFLLICVVLSLVYGGIHLATWNFAFASKTEHLLWKIACIDIMATIPIGVLSIVGPKYMMDLRLGWRGRRERKMDIDLKEPLNLAILCVLSVPYALSRLYIVVESFISLRHVPIGVYAAVPWVQAIPHV